MRKRTKTIILCSFLGISAAKCMEISMADIVLLHRGSEKRETPARQFVTKYCEFIAERADYHGDFVEVLSEIERDQDKKRFFQIYHLDIDNLQAFSQKSFTMVLNLALAEHKDYKDVLNNYLFPPVVQGKSDFDILGRIRKSLLDVKRMYGQSLKDLILKQRKVEKMYPTLPLEGKLCGRFTSNQSLHELEGFCNAINSLMSELNLLLPEPIEDPSSKEQLKKDQLAREATFLPTLPKAKNRPQKKNAKHKGAPPKPKLKEILEIEAAVPNSTTIVKVETSEKLTAPGPDMIVVQPPAVEAQTQIVLHNDESRESFLVSELVRETFGELVGGQYSLDNYHRQLHKQFLLEKKLKRLCEDQETEDSSEEVSFVMNLGAHFATIESIFSCEVETVSWENLETLITNGLAGVVENASGNTARIIFNHPFVKKQVKFLLHRPHPRPHLYEDLMKRIVKNFGYYNLTLDSFIGRNSPGSKNSPVGSIIPSGKASPVEEK
jgi:hypothetical protein